MESVESLPAPATGAELQLAISRYYISASAEQPVFYSIAVSVEGQSWSVDRRYSEFHDLHTILCRRFGQMPALPRKTLQKIKEAPQLEARREALDLWVKAVALRADILHAPEARGFLLLDQQLNLTQEENPVKVTELEFQQTVRSIKYEADKGVLFVLTSENWLPGLGAAARKIAGDKVDIGAGTLYCFTTQPGRYQFVSVWQRAIEASFCMSWNEDLTVLAVGADSGRVLTFRVSVESQYSNVETYCVDRAHAKRVVAVSLEAHTSYVFSCSEDKQFRVFELTSQNPVSDIEVGNSPLTDMQINRARNRAIISAQNGVIYLIDTAYIPSRLLSSIQNSTRSQIRSLHVDWLSNYIFAPCKDGGICVFELGKGERERFSKQVALLQGRREAKLSQAW